MNQRHSNDEETARQTKSFTEVSTAVLLPLLGKEKSLLTPDAFKKVSLEILHISHIHILPAYAGKQEQVSLFLAICATVMHSEESKKHRRCMGGPC